MPNTDTDPALRRVRHLRAKDVADLLQVDRATIWRLCVRIDRPLPCLRLGTRCTRFSLSALEAWLAREGGGQ